MNDGLKLCTVGLRNKMGYVAYCKCLCKRHIRPKPPHRLYPLVGKMCTETILNVSPQAPAGVGDGAGREQRRGVDGQGSAGCDGVIRALQFQAKRTWCLFHEGSSRLRAGWQPLQMPPRIVANGNERSGILCALSSSSFSCVGVIDVFVFFFFPCRSY